MSLDFAALDHNCNVIRREIEEEFKNLTILFIPHRPGERLKSLTDKANNILGKSYGQKIYDFILLNNIIDNDKTAFMGLIPNESFLKRLFGRKHYTAVFFINSAEFMADDNVRHSVYHLAWYALSLYLKQISRQAALPQSLSKNKDIKLITTERGSLNRARNSLMADIFGAILMENSGHKGFIEYLGKKRSQDTMSKRLGYLAEHFPYPIAYEACRLLFEDIKSTLKEKPKPLHQALELAQEIDETYDDEAIQQWKSFSLPAQEMAWNDYEVSIILGQAIYTSDDTNVRALAYQIAELVDVEPSSNFSSVEYNPFANKEIARRQHESQCEDIFGRLVSIAALQNEVFLMRQEANKQNERLAEGKISGWCAMALEAAADAFEATHNDDALQPSEMAAQAYYKAQRILSYTQIEKLGLTALYLKRTGKKLPLDQFADYLPKDNDMQELRNYFQQRYARKASKQRIADETEDFSNINLDEEVDFIKARLQIKN